MKSHLKLCQTNAEYNAFKYDYENNTRPNVVVVKEGKKIHFNKLYKPVIHATFNATSDNKTAIAQNLHIIKSLKIDGQEMVTTPPVSKIETIEIKKNKITINSDGNVTNFPSTYVKPQCYKWILKPTNANIKITDCHNILLLLSVDGSKGAIGGEIDQLDTETFIDKDNNCFILPNDLGLNSNLSMGVVLANENKTTGAFDIIDTTCIVEYVSGGLNENKYNLSTEGEHFLEIQLLDNCSIGRMFKETCISHITKLKDVTSIDMDAFRECQYLTSVVIPDGVTSIGNNAFYSCKSLTEITISDSVTEIGKYAFYNCKNLAEFNSMLATEDKRCIVIDGKLSAFAPAGLTSYVIPEDVTEIGDYVFQYCSNLTSVAIPNSVTEIGSEAFRDCHGLTEITIPGSVTTIGDEAFYYCTSLASATIGNGLISVGANPFANCANLTNFNSNFTSEDKRCWIIDNKLIAFAPAGLTSYIIPDGVTSIGEEAFYYCTSLTSLVIPEGVTEISEFAFYRCYNLTSVVIPDGVTTIGERAFQFCDNLTSITIPNSVTSIGEYAFYDAGLIDVYCQRTTPPTGGSRMFSSNASGRKIYVPVESVEVYKSAPGWSDYADAIIKMQENYEIYYRTFDDNIVTPYSSSGFGANIVSNTYENGIGVITFNGDITSIGQNAFQNCTSLTDIFIPDSVITIGDGAFEGCSKLTKFKYKYASPDKRCIIIDNKLIALAPAGLTSYNIPDSVTYIGGYAFSNCSSLTSITIPEGVTEIGERAFYNCKSLTSITIPDSVTSIGSGAFYGCSILTSAYLGSGVTSIGYMAFYNCSKLISITIPDSVTEIGERAFYNCKSLTSITIPEGVTSIGSRAFYSCSKLTSITIPDCVTEIGYEAFRACSNLTSITIPDSVTEIGANAFYGCSKLDSVYCKATTPPAGGSSMFSYNADNRKIYVPMALINIYKSAQYWSSYANDILGTLKNNEISYVSSDSTIVTPYSSSVFGANIVSNTYENGIGIITFDADVTSIGSQAFYDCDSLTSITIPNSVTSIGERAFYTCSTLTSITIPEGVTTIGERAFYLCKALASVNIPNGVTSIENSAFFGCFNLAEITIPDSVTLIDAMAFQGCSSLTEITIPSNVTTIRAQALYCNSLTSVYCKPIVPPAVGASIFWDNIAGRKIYVPMSSVDTYKAASVWSGYADAIEGYNF